MGPRSGQRTLAGAGKAVTAVSRWCRAAGGLLGVLALLGASERGLAAEPAPVAWYVGAGGGPGWSTAMDKMGYNRDTTCSPNRNCGGRVVEGFRWFQDLVPAAGRTFEVTAGRRTGRLRVELSATQQTHAAAVETIGITYLDGSERAPRIADSPYTSRSTNSVGDLTTRTLSLNVYRDLPLRGSRATPYLGGGLGVAFIEVSRLYFHSDYSCRPGRTCDPPADRYDTVKSADLRDAVPAAHLYAGVGFRLSDRLALDLKFAYRAVGDLADRRTYRRHEFPGLAFHESVAGIRQGSVLLGVRYAWAAGAPP